MDNLVTEKIIQVIGIAYGYQPSKSVRHHLTKDISNYHSAKHSDFSYFFKGYPGDLPGSNSYLNLCPIETKEPVEHWPEPELAILLGDKHEIIGYTLANDLTAHSIETLGRSADFDGTYAGKVWNGSGSFSRDFTNTKSIPNPYELEINLRIERMGKIICDRSYTTEKYKFRIEEIPSKVIDLYRTYEKVPLSKKIQVDSSGFLPAGTLIMLGTGIIVKKEQFCKTGDVLTISCEGLPTLINTIS